MRLGNRDIVVSSSTTTSAEGRVLELGGRLPLSSASISAVPCRRLGRIVHRGLRAPVPTAVVVRSQRMMMMIVLVMMIDAATVMMKPVAATAVLQPARRVAQLDVAHVRGDRVLVRLEIRTLRPARPAHAVQACLRVATHATEDLEEEVLEAPAEDHVDDEVHAAVYRHEEVADLDEPGGRVHVDVLVDVARQRQDVADQEDYHHAEEHRRQADLATLVVGETAEVPIGLPHL